MTICQFSEVAFYLMAGAWAFSTFAFVYCAARKHRKHGP